MQAEIIRAGVIIGVAAVAALSVGYTTRHLESGSAPEIASAGVIIGAPSEPPASMPSEPRLAPPAIIGQGAPPPMAVPVTAGPIEPTPAPSAPAPTEPTWSDEAPSSPPPPRRSHAGGMRASPHIAAEGPDLSSIEPAGGAAPPPRPSLPGLVPPNIPGIDPTDPSTWPPETRPPAAAGDPIGGGAAPPSEKVLSYFQQAKTHIDTKSAFGFVLFPRVALTTQEKQTQKDFCEIILASLDFLSPGAVETAVAEHHDILATYWPIDPSHNSFDVSTAFAARDCDDLIAWYDHKLARALAAKAGVAHLGGPLLITWPSSGVNERDRDPLVVDFSKANHERATKALQYWFRQLRNKPSLWTNRIREGTIRAELADAVNDTAGVMLAVLAGKWDTLTTVTASATP